MDTKREGRENAGNQLKCRGCRILNSWVRQVLDIDKRAGFILGWAGSIL